MPKSINFVENKLVNGIKAINIYGPVHWPWRGTMLNDLQKNLLWGAHLVHYEFTRRLCFFQPGPSQWLNMRFCPKTDASAFALSTQSERLSQDPYAVPPSSSPFTGVRPASWTENSSNPLLFLLPFILRIPPIKSLACLITPMSAQRHKGTYSIISFLERCNS